MPNLFFREATARMIKTKTQHRWIYALGYIKLWPCRRTDHIRLFKNSKRKVKRTIQTEHR